ncbi:hypothetical protein YC2023_058511 [Brassica napus]
MNITYPTTKKEQQSRCHLWKISFQFSNTWLQIKDKHFPVRNTSPQVSHSKTIDVGCVKNCIVNQCMKASKKATPATCDNPCKTICTATGIKSYIIPRGGGRDPLDVATSLDNPLPCACFNGTDNYLLAVYFSYVVSDVDILAGIARSYQLSSKKATPATCDNPCKTICTATGIKSYIIPRGGGRDPIKVTGASISGGKGLTAVSTATWVRFPTTAKFNIRAAATQISPLGLGSLWGNCQVHLYSNMVVISPYSYLTLGVTHDKSMKKYEPAYSKTRLKPISDRYSPSPYFYHMIQKIWEPLKDQNRVANELLADRRELERAETGRERYRDRLSQAEMGRELAGIGNALDIG